MITFTATMISSMQNLVIKKFHGLAVTMIMAMIIGYGCTMNMFIVVVMSRHEQKNMILTNFHRQAMTTITAMIIIVEGNINIHELAITIIMAVISSYKPIMIVIMVMMLHVG